MHCTVHAKRFAQIEARVQWSEMELGKAISVSKQAVGGTIFRPAFHSDFLLEI